MTGTEPDGDGFDYGQTVVLQHDATCGPSTLGEVLDARAHHRPWRLVDLAAGAPLPAFDDVRGVVVLGGPMGAGDDDRHPWLAAERDAIRSAVEGGIPVFGICLGVQLLGAALGGEVRRRDVPRIGFFALERTGEAHDDPVFAGWPDGAAVLFMNSDEVARLPDGAVPMLVADGEVVAWRAPGELSYGVQFHPEVDAAQLQAWTGLEHNVPRLQQAGVDGDALVAEAQRRQPFTRAVGLSLVGRWLDAVVGREDPDPKRRRRG